MKKNKPNLTLEVFKILLLICKYDLLFCAALLMLFEQISYQLKSILLFEADLVKNAKTLFRLIFLPLFDFQIKAQLFYIKI